MEPALIREILLVQHRAFTRNAVWVRRDILDALPPLIPLPHAVIISGLRRAGKSTVLREIKDEFYPDSVVYYCNFEDERFLKFTVDDFQVLHECFMELFGESTVFFLDEVQNVPGWEAFVRRKVDAGCKFFITGSNASMLSKELGTRLTGRYVSIELYPFSFKEFIASKHGLVAGHVLPETRATCKRLLGEYLERGGIPEYLKFGEGTIINMLYDNILYRDVMARHNLTDERSLKELAFYLISNAGTEISFNKLKSMLALGSVNTIKNYIEFIENAYLLFTVYKHDISVKRQIHASKKVYVVDPAFINLVAFKLPRFAGKVLENVVYLELRRRGNQVFFFKGAGECDFLVVDKNVVVEAIQVTTTLHESKEREYKGLFEAMDTHGLGVGTIIVEDDEFEERVGEKKIIVRPAWKWLLGLP